MTKAYEICELEVEKRWGHFFIVSSIKILIYNFFVLFLCICMIGALASAMSALRFLYRNDGVAV